MEWKWTQLKTKWKESMYKQNINNPPKHLSQTVLGFLVQPKTQKILSWQLKMLFLYLCCQISSLLHLYQSPWTSDALSQSSSFSILGGFNLIQVVILTSSRGWIHSFLCYACSKSLNHIICGLLPMATASLTLKTKVLSDFGKYVFY